MEPIELQRVVFHMPLGIPGTESPEQNVNAEEKMGRRDPVRIMFHEARGMVVIEALTKDGKLRGLAPLLVPMSNVAGMRPKMKKEPKP